VTTMDHPTSHLDLIAGARTLRAAAEAADVDTVHSELCRLRNLLTQHLSCEDDSIRQLSPLARRVVTDGQRRLRALIDEFLARAGTPGGSGCECVARSGELLRQLTRQARLENGLLRGPRW
jgi:hypothetical protein